jgi:hypothetical protein
MKAASRAFQNKYRVSARLKFSPSTKVTESVRLGYVGT